jgi:hypothetical protein
MTNVPMRRTRGAMDVHRRLLNTHPEYARARAAIENRALAFASGGARRHLDGRSTTHARWPSSSDP